MTTLDSATAASLYDLLSRLSAEVTMAKGWRGRANVHISLDIIEGLTSEALALLTDTPEGAR